MGSQIVCIRTVRPAWMLNHPGLTANPRPCRAAGRGCTFRLAGTSPNLHPSRRRTAVRRPTRLLVFFECSVARAGERVRGRPQGRPARPAVAHAAPAPRGGPAGDRGQPRVLPGPVRDQPWPLRADRRRRPLVPAQVGRAGDRAPPGTAGHVHGQAVQRPGRLRVPRARLGQRRIGEQRVRRPGRARRAVTGRPARDRRSARARTGAERPAQPDDQFLQTIRARHARAVADRLATTSSRRSWPTSATKSSASSGSLPTGSSASTPTTCEGKDQRTRAAIARAHSRASVWLVSTSTS